MVVLERLEIAVDVYGKCCSDMSMSLELSARIPLPVVPVHAMHPNSSWPSLLLGPHKSQHTCSLQDSLPVFWDHVSSNLMITAVSLLLLLGSHVIFGIKLDKNMTFNFGFCVVLGPVIFSDVLQVTTSRWYHFPMFLVAYDFLYYGIHRFFHRFKIHFLHHKKLQNPIQCLDFEPLEFVFTPLAVFVTSRILPIPALGIIVFLGLYFLLQLVVHTGEERHWPIFISPYDHAVHHTKHSYNFASIFKAPDQIFGTYYWPRKMSVVLSPRPSQ